MKFKKIITAFLTVTGIVCMTFSAGAATNSEFSDNIQNIEKESAVPKTPVITGNSFTPNGAGTVVDNATDEDGKEFYTITTDEGNVFYLVIDRTRGYENVYFLNSVTEADLLGLIKDDKIKSTSTAENLQQESSQSEEEKITPVKTENANNSASDNANKNSNNSDNSSNSDSKPSEKSNQILGMDSSTVMIIVVTVIFVGGAGYFKLKKSKKKPKGRRNSSNDDGDDYDDYDDDYDED